MNNEQYIAYIKKLSIWELTQEVLDDPSLIADPYYREFGRAINDRFDELKQIEARKAARRKAEER